MLPEKRGEINRGDRQIKVISSTDGNNKSEKTNYTKLYGGLVEAPAFEKK